MGLHRIAALTLVSLSVAGISAPASALRTPSATEIERARIQFLIAAGRNEQLKTADNDLYKVLARPFATEKEKAEAAARARHARDERDAAYDVALHMTADLYGIPRTSSDPGLQWKIVFAEKFEDRWGQPVGTADLPRARPL